MEGKTETQQKLADLYEESESLWNTKIKDYHNKSKDNDCLDLMSRELG